MRLLLTGFEPFGGERINPSGEIVRAVAADSPAGVEVVPLILPVRVRVAFERLLPALDEPGLDAWLGLGQAGGRTHLSVERVGINLLIDRGEELPDEVAGPREQALVEAGAAAYFARLPVAEIAARIAAAGAPAVVSNSAGAYICNEALYVVQHHLATTGRDLPSGFIHVPYLPEQAAGKRVGTPSIALATQVLGVRAAIAAVGELVAGRARAVAR